MGPTRVELRYPYNVIERIGFYDSKIFTIPYGTLSGDQSRRLEECFLDLYDLERQVILLKYRDRMSNKQIADALGKSQTTILSYLRRAIIKLKSISRVSYVIVGNKLPEEQLIVITSRDLKSVRLGLWILILQHLDY